MYIGSPRGIPGPVGNHRAHPGRTGTMHSGQPALVLGLDIGGTTSRALVGDLSGRTLGTGEAGGGNPNSHPPEQAARQVADAARAALSGVDPSHVRGGVLG